MLLGKNVNEGPPYTYTGITHSARPSQTLRLQWTFITRRPPGRMTTTKSHNPQHATPASYHTHQVWPPPLSLATTHGITVVFSSCGY